MYLDDDKTKLFASIIPLLLGGTAFLSLNPYFLWNNKYIYWLLILVLALLTVVVFFVRMKISTKSFFLTIFFIYVFVLHQSLVLQGIPVISTPLIIFLIFVFVDYEDKLRASFVFRDLYVISLVPSLIYFVLILFGIDFGWSILDSQHYAKAGAGHYYRNYFGMVILSNQVFLGGFGEIFRLSGMFDEPGVVGTISGMFLTANSFKVSDWKNKVLLLSGIFSFSLAFYFIAIIYLGLKKPFILLFVVFFSFVLVQFVVPEDIKENPIINRYIIERADKVIHDFKSIDNRVSVSFKNYYTEFLESEFVMNGIGKDAHKLLNCNVSSYKQLIYNHGIIGFSLMVLFYIVFTIFYLEKKQYKYVLPFIIVSLAIVYQRPDISRAWFVIIYFYGLTMSKQIQLTKMKCT